jgi:hypothetical protein
LASRWSPPASDSDVQPKLAARIRLLATDASNKNDPHSAPGRDRGVALGDAPTGGGGGSHGR